MEPSAALYGGVRPNRVVFLGAEQSLEFVGNRWLQLVNHQIASVGIGLCLVYYKCGCVLLTSACARVRPTYTGRGVMLERMLLVEFGDGKINSAVRERGV